MQKGFTIIEVTVASMLIIALGFGILGLQYLVGDAQIASINSFIGVEEGNATVAQIVREIRTARPGENAAFAIELADDNELIFYSDVDFDGQAEKVRYFLQANELRRSVIEPQGVPVIYPDASAKTKAMAENVQNAGVPIFFYHNKDWPQDTINNPLLTPADLSEINLIRIALIINPRPSQPEEELVLESSVHLRTLKNNL